MDYRHATPTGPEGQVVYGPFPVRLERLVCAVVLLVVGASLLVTALDDARLACDRPSDRCEYRASYLALTPDTFPLSRLRGARVDIQYGTKGAKHGLPVLDLTDRQQGLSSVDVDRAQRFVHAVEKALAEKRARFAVDLPGDRGFLMGATFFLALAGLALSATLRGIGRVVLVARGGQLHLTGRVFGVPLRGDAFDLYGLTDVEVEWEHRKTLFAAKGSPGETYGRLVLVRGDAREPLTDARFPGYHVHRRAERALRDFLALPPRAREREQALASDANRYHPPPFGGGVPAPILAWVGICFGVITCLPFAFLVVTVFGLAGRPPGQAVIGVALVGGAALGVAVAFAVRRRADAR